ncbi:MAG: hypothetical protein ACI9VR_004112, partial [Cognaticolwellia sp.]
LVVATSHQGEKEQHCQSSSCAHYSGIFLARSHFADR